MSYIDYIILLLIIIGFILGFKDGLVRKIIGLTGIIAGIFLAVKFSEKLGKYFAPLMDNEIYLSEIIAGILIFIIAVLIASIVKRLVHPHDKVNKLVNQLLGGLTGIIQMIFFLSIMLLFLNLFKFPENDVAQKSLFYKPVYNLVPNTIEFLIGGKDIVKEYIEQKDTVNINQMNVVKQKQKD